MKSDRIVKDFFDPLRIRRKKQIEIRKFADSRRKKIYDSVVLSEEQRQAIDELYIRNYGEKIPYTWHQYYTAFTGKFDPFYFPELLYIPEFEYYMS